MKTLSLSLAGLLAGSLLSATSLAQTISGPSLLEPGAGLSRPDQSNPLHVPNRLTLVYPADLPRPPPTREELVDVRVNIDAAGKVGKVQVLDGFHDKAIERMVENAVKQASFTPATAGGQNVPFENLELQILQRSAYPPGVTEEMRADLAKLGEQLDAKDYRGAERLIESMLDRKAVRLFELALLEDQLASVYMATERAPEALVAMRLVTGRSPAVLPSLQEAAASPDAIYPDSFLPPDLYVEALRKQVMVSLLNNQTGEALRTYALLQDVAGATGHDDVIAAVTPQIEKINTLLASEEPVGSVIRLIDGKWVYTMSPRRTFGVTGLDGKVDAVDVACGDNPVRRLPFQNDSEWRIPDSWGQCDLIFRGKNDSKFVLYEYLN